MNPFFAAYCRIFQGAFRILSPMLPWRKPELIEGDNSLLRIPEIMQELGLQRPLLVTDGMLMKLGLPAPLLQALGEKGMQCRVYDKVVPNPTIDNIEEAYELYRQNDCDSLIAFGGGSPMDCCKGVGARVARPKKTIPQMKGLLKIRRKLPVLFAIPTTAGTGSEATLAAVVTNSSTHEKYPMNDFSLIPAYAVLDASLTLGLPPHITSTTGMDALTHAVEAYIGHSNTKETAQMAKDATVLIFKYLKRAYDDGKDVEARKNMQLAAFYAGVAFTRAYVGNVHALAHTLGGFYGVPHGLANAVILPHVLDFYGASAHKRLAELADLVGISGNTDEEKANAFIAEIRAMNAYMKIPDKIEGKIKEEDIPTMAKRANKEANPLYPVPRLMDVAQMEQMFRNLMG